MTLVDLGKRAATAFAERERVLFSLAAALLSTGLGLALLAFRDLPMMDLPQHAVQVATWAHWAELSAADRAALEVNLHTPYLLAYVLARAVSPLVGVVVALKLIVLLAALGNAIALWLLARRLGHTPWLALLGLPSTFGFSFYYGFVSFLLATPLVILAVVIGIEHARRPTWPRGLGLAAVLCITLVAHGFAAALCLLGVGGLLLFGSPGTAVFRLAPLVAPALLGFAWLAPNLRERALVDSTIRPGRATHWLSLIAGPGTFRDGLALAVAVGLAASVIVCLGRPSRSPGRFALLAAAVTGYALIPTMLWNTAFLHERCVGFLVPALMLACEPRRSSASQKGPSAALAFGVCAVWLVCFSARLAGFNREMADYHALMDELPAGLRVRPLIFARDSRAFPGTPAYLHVSAYYHAEKGGIPAYNFAVQPSAVIRYRPGHWAQLAPGLEWVAERFDASVEAERYHYFLVRAESVPPDLFDNSPLPIALDACRGSFCGFRRAESLVSR